MNETPQQAARRLSAKAIREGFQAVALHAYTDADGEPMTVASRSALAIPADRRLLVRLAPYAVEFRALSVLPPRSPELRPSR